MNRVKQLYLLMFLLLALCTQANGQKLSPSFSLRVEGDVLHPSVYTLEDLRNKPRDTAFLTSREGHRDQYEGVAIKALLKEVGVSGTRPLRGENLAKFALVQCADGYEVLLSLGELDEEFGNNPILLADRMNNQDLSAGKGPFRLIVPGDKALARSCYQVKSIYIGFGTAP